MGSRVSRNNEPRKCCADPKQQCQRISRRKNEARQWQHRETGCGREFEEDSRFGECQEETGCGPEREEETGWRLGRRSGVAAGGLATAGRASHDFEALEVLEPRGRGQPRREFVPLAEKESRRRTEPRAGHGALPKRPPVPKRPAQSQRKRR